ncbi:MAG: DUF2141 domain-containing protein [Bacteroidota bacterium]
MLRLPFLCFLFLSMACSAQAQNSLNISVEGVKKIKGEVFVALFNQSEGFPGGDARFREAVVKVEQSTVQIQFDNLPAASYAVSLFHDVNESGDMDTNWMGIPKEPYGFSNNPRIVFRAPTYEDCSFSVEQDTQVKINLK